MLTLSLLGSELFTDSIVRLEPTAVVVIRASAPIVRFDAGDSLSGNGVAFDEAWAGTVTAYDSTGHSAAFKLRAQPGSYLLFHCDDDL